MADITIIMPSYNKEKYISEALDSVFMQKTTYTYHIIVADDCSSDGTIDIVKKYQRKYPKKITLLTSKKNQKLYKNVIRAYEITKTDYFCVLDPDDFWTDEYKIQKALDFLENNKDFTIYVTDTEMMLSNGEKKPFNARSFVADSSLEDFFHNRAVLGCTLGSVYRNVVFKKGLPRKMKVLESPTNEKSFRGDTFRNVIHLEKGKAHHVPEVDAVYRITDEGVWTSLDIAHRALLNINLFKDLWFYFDKKYPDFLWLSWNAYNYYAKDLCDIYDKDDKSFFDSAKEIFYLLKLYKENESVLDDVVKKRKDSLLEHLSLKNRLGLKVYEYLHKKLQKKGII